MRQFESKDKQCSNKITRQQEEKLHYPKKENVKYVLHKWEVEFYTINEKESLYQTLATK